MRVTISLDDRLAAAARIRAREGGMSLGNWINRALEERLARAEPAAEACGFHLVTVGGNGPLLGTDLDRTSELTVADDVRAYSTILARRM